MALVSTQPLKEMSTRNFPGGKRWLAYKADNLTAICEPNVQKMWKPQRLTTLWASMACYRDSFTFTTDGVIISYKFIENCDLPFMVMMFAVKKGMGRQIKLVNMLPFFFVVHFMLLSVFQTTALNGSMSSE
jgi:hypothetical protein